MTTATATEEKKVSKPLAPNAAIQELQAKIYAKLATVVDGENATTTASEDTFYNNLPSDKTDDLPNGVTRAVADTVLTYASNHSAAALGAVGQKNIETLAANPNVKMVAGLITGADGIENQIFTEREYRKNVAGKEVVKFGRTTITVDNSAIGKTGQMGRVLGHLKLLAAETLTAPK